MSDQIQPPDFDAMRCVHCSETRRDHLTRITGRGGLAACLSFEPREMPRRDHVPYIGSEPLWVDRVPLQLAAPPVAVDIVLMPTARRCPEHPQQCDGSKSTCCCADKHEVIQR